MFWGIILIIAGLGWLLQNLGYLEGTIWTIFWPVVVIAFGISLLFKRSKWSHWCCGPWERHHEHREHHEHHEEPQQ